MTASAQTRRPRFAVMATVGAAALLMALQAAPEAPPPGSDAPASRAPAAPAVTLPSTVLDAASVYIAYVDRAAGVSPAFSDGASVASALRSTEAYQSKQLQRGITAYAAIVALQDPTFVASVRKFGVDPNGRAQVAAALVADPRYATAFPGADSAAGLIIAALTDQGQRIIDTGKRVKQAAYDIQHQTWSKDTVPNRDDRLALAKSLSESPLSPEADTEARLQLASTGATPLLISGSANAGPYSPTVTRALAVAAMAALGEGAEDNSEQLSAMLDDEDEGECLHSAKLSLYECLAVAKPHYEDVFCMGQHVLMDTGQCVIKSITPRLAAPPVLIAAVDTTPRPLKKGLLHKVASHRKKHVAKP
jgi:hypothetical protein